MPSYTPKFISFARERMARQGEEIRVWVKSENPLLSETCRDIIDAAQARAGTT